MKMKKLISSALVCVLLFGAVIGIVPIKAKAASTAANSVGESLGAEAVWNLVESMLLLCQYESAEEMLNEEYEEGYILPPVTSKNGRYSIYVNRYTGFVYYVDNLTGQILTSNPYTYEKTQGNVISETTAEMQSQLVITYSETTKNTSSKLYSSRDAAMNSQISVEYIANGFRVNYTLGDTVARYLLPGYITAEKFEGEILVPMLNEFRDLLRKYCGDAETNFEADVEGRKMKIKNAFDIFESTKHNPPSSASESVLSKYSVYYKETINLESVQMYLDDMYNNVIKNKFNLQNNNLGTDAYRELYTLYSDIMTMYASGQKGYYLRNLNKYAKTSTMYNSLLETYYSNKNSEIKDTLEPIYEYTGTTNPQKDSMSKLFEKYINKYRTIKSEQTGEELIKYSFTEMYEDENYCGYVDQTDPKPVFRCALEYSFNEDGSLSVRLPANSISFDETLYNLETITVLKYFGAANGRLDGQIFFPDGSGMILELEDFYDPIVSSIKYTSLKADIYGADNSYSPEVDPAKITGAFREHVSMPVFGVIGTESASTKTQSYGAKSVNNGYFAIVENGASLGSLEFQTGAGNTASAYCVYSPYPSDKYDLSSTVTVGGADYYTIVSDAKFNGSYVTRYVMLTDETVGEKINSIYGIGYYPSTYSGMAAYYRDYLYNDGTLKALTDVKENMPLYIEALGSMDIMEKFLTFPVEKSIPLTTFEDVETMYNELRNSSAVLKEEMDKYQALADAEPEGSAKKAEYQKLADEYKNYTNFVINNINFRLTGFGSGGLNSNYPTKLSWEKACGGKRAFKKLVQTAKDVNDSGDVFGIYPEYDFMYLSYASAFDGVSKKQDLSKMIDNRYASKQAYDSISRQYVSYFTLVVNPESLDRLYSKFIKKYSKYDVTGISVSTMGSDLNSNFDEEKSINRDDAQNYVETVLARIVKQNGYSVMLDKGNAYSIRYATHLLNVSTDSSRVRYSSYSIPFVGMILHGSVNYAGAPLNYSGMPEYDLLRSIESGAALYFILCYQNESYMKNDAILNDYFGVKYSSWYKDIVLNYNKLNNAIGGLQSYIISEHKTLIGERVVDAEEQITNYKLLMDEIITMLDAQIDVEVSRGYAEIAKKGESGWKLKVNIDKDKLVSQFEDILKLDFDSSEVTSNKNINAVVNSFLADLDNLIADYNREYPGAESGTLEYTVSFDELTYGVSNILLTEMLKLINDEISDFVDEQEQNIKKLNEEVKKYNDEAEAYNANLAEGEAPKALQAYYQFVLSVGRDAILDTMASICKIDSKTLAEMENVEYTYEENGQKNTVLATFGEHLDSIIAIYQKGREDYTEQYDELGVLTTNKKHKGSLVRVNTEQLYLYTSKYSFLTDSSAFDENYVYTDYTNDRGNIVLVTYKDPKTGDEVRFLLNYNIYTVKVKLDDGKVYTLGKYEYVPNV